MTQDPRVSSRPTPSAQGARGTGKLSYAVAGVDIDAGEAFVDAIKPALSTTRRPGVMGSVGGFGALFDLRQTGLSDPILVSGTDGVGSKLLLAESLDDYRGLGQDLVAMCTNDILCQGARALFFLDYLAAGRLSPERDRALVEGIAAACAAEGAALVGGETAELPGLYAEGHFDLAGFDVGAVEREA
ncbi:MAG: AIR synthase related protein, partial [Pseudomonadota bacterium]|nr:AIR synthase related protein [Pseudomonadota bacterium]